MGRLAYREDGSVFFTWPSIWLFWSVSQSVSPSVWDGVGQVMSFYYWQLVSRSVRLSLESLIVTHGPYFSSEENSVLSVVGRPTWQVDGATMYRRSQSLCYVCVHTRVDVDPVLILLLLLLLLLLLMLLCTRVYARARPVSSGTVQQIMPTLYTYGSLDTWTATKFQLFVFPMLGFDFAYASATYYREFVWLLPASYIFLLYNYSRAESGMSDVKRGSMCALVGHQWCGGPYFALRNLPSMRHAC
jgi:hypothetical protein